MLTCPRFRLSRVKSLKSSTSSTSSCSQRTNHPPHNRHNQHSHYPPRPTLTNTPTSSYATAAALTRKPSPDNLTTAPPIQRHPPTQPPSHKPPEIRKSQLHRAYTSLLRSTPLILLFQHSNLTATELAGIRRELSQALRRASASTGAETAADDPVAQGAKLQVVQTNILAAALRVVEFYHPHDAATSAPVSAAEQAARTTRSQTKQTHTHSISRTAHSATLHPDSPTNPSAPPRKKNHSLHALLSGPIALLTFPSLQPTHLAAALSVLAPTRGATSAFPAPKRRAAPGYYEGSVQSGLQKLVLLGGRVDERIAQGRREMGGSRTLDLERVREVGGLAARGGLEGLRGELVGLMQSAGMGLVGGLESAMVGVWGTLEGRRRALEEEEEGKGGDGMDKE
ncbi:MAG: hypothetical protein M1831_003020 [Alyxoria varia]|nr:MAG: hypothetical protein M1831_003020 [Alyxoria varia]